MWQFRHTFFKSKKRAKEYAAEVGGNVYPKDSQQFELELSVVDDEDYYREHFGYVVV